jgi:hypothetical protein
MATRAALTSATESSTRSPRSAGQPRDSGSDSITRSIAVRSTAPALPGAVCASRRLRTNLACRRLSRRPRLRPRPEPGFVERGLNRDPERHPGFDRSGVVEYVAGSVCLMVVDTSGGTRPRCCDPEPWQRRRDGSRRCRDPSSGSALPAVRAPWRGRAPTPDDRSSSRVAQWAIKSPRASSSGNDPAVRTQP